MICRPATGRVSLAAALAIVVLLTSGFSWATVGDSVMFDARQEITQRDGYVRGYAGVDIRQGRPAIRRLRHLGYERVVIALGLWDVVRVAPVDLRRRIRAMMRDDARGIDCVLWVNLKTTSRVHVNWPSRARRFNSILADLAPRYGVRVLRFSVVAPRHPRWFRSDGVHLTPRGQRGYAAWLSDRVDHFC